MINIIMMSSLPRARQLTTTRTAAAARARKASSRDLLLLIFVCQLLQLWPRNPFLEAKALLAMKVVPNAVAAAPRLPRSSPSSPALFAMAAPSSSPHAPSYAWRDPRYLRRPPGAPRPGSSGYSSSSRSLHPPQHRPGGSEDYSEHFLDADAWKNDRRSRPFTVDFKSRRPGKMSLTSRIIWVNVLAYAVQAFRPSFTSWGIKLSEPILRGRELHRLVTPMFLHGSIAHLATNMYSLNQAGNDVERIFGPGRFLALYAASGVAGTLASALLSPNPSLGASGAVFGVVGAYFTFLTRNAWLLGPVGESMSSSIAQTLLVNVAYGLVNPVIDNWAHLGGALAGAGMAYYFGPRLYLSEDPSLAEEAGTARYRFLVDRPVLRLPRSIESIPEKIGRRLERIARRMRVERYRADTPDTPWRRRQQHQQQWRPPGPNRSIKPRKF
jgi:membrane associated rhomboid family serine protease